MDHSDLEELLEDSPTPRRTWSFPSRVLLVLGLVAVAGLALSGSKGVGLRSKSSGSAEQVKHGKTISNGFSIL